MLDLSFTRIKTNPSKVLSDSCDVLGVSVIFAKEKSPSTCADDAIVLYYILRSVHLERWHWRGVRNTSMSTYLNCPVYFLPLVELEVIHHKRCHFHLEDDQSRLQLVPIYQHIQQ